MRPCGDKWIEQQSQACPGVRLMMLQYMHSSTELLDM